MRLLSTPLPVITPLFLTLKAVDVVLEVLHERAGLGPFVKNLGLAFEDLSASGHGRSSSEIAPPPSAGARVIYQLSAVNTIVPRRGRCGRGA